MELPLDSLFSPSHERLSASSSINPPFVFRLSTLVPSVSLILRVMVSERYAALELSLSPFMEVCS